MDGNLAPVPAPGALILGSIGVGCADAKHCRLAARLGCGDGQKAKPLFSFQFALKSPDPTSDTLRLESGHFRTLKSLSQPSYRRS